MGKYYPCRLENMFIIELPTVLKFFWCFGKLFMDKSLREKILVLGNSFYEEITKKIDPSQLEKKFGGLARNKIRKFFPPTSRL